MFDYEDAHFRDTIKYKRRANTWLQKESVIKKYIDSSKYVLELGCGEVPIFEESFKVDLVDTGKINLVQDLNKPLSIVNNFDAIISLEVIGHLYDVDTFLSECYRLLKPNGLLFISSLNVKHWKTRLKLLFGNDNIFDDNGYYFWRFSPSSLVRKLREHKFDIIERVAIGKLPIDFAGRFMLVCKKGD